MNVYSLMWKDGPPPGKSQVKNSCVLSSAQCVEASEVSTLLWVLCVHKKLFKGQDSRETSCGWHLVFPQASFGTCVFAFLQSGNKVILSRGEETGTGGRSQRTDHKGRERGQLGKGWAF